MNEMELQTTLDPIEMDMGDPEIEYSPVLPNPEGEPTDDLTKVTIQGNIYQIKDPEVHDWARAEEKPTYTKAEVGLDKVDNTSDMDKPVSTATQTALDNKVDKVAGKGLSEEDFTHTLKNKLDGIEAGAEVNTVNSVAGKTGNVTLDKSDVGLGNVDNTSDMNKPVSTATQEALQGLASATQTALNGKVDNSTLNNYYTKTETDTALGNKVDKVQGKGLSTNDYDDTAKGIVDGVTTALSGKVDKEEGYGLSKNDYTDEEKAKVGEIDNKLDKTETAVNSNGLVIATPVADTAPYIYRQTPVKESFKALMKKIVGASVVWNQILINGNFANISGWSTTAYWSLSVANNIATLTSVSVYTQPLTRTDISQISGHKVLVSVNAKPSVNSSLSCALNSSNFGTDNVFDNYSLTANVWTNIKRVVATTENSDGIRIGYRSANALAVGETLQLKELYMVDLTAMFGTTIADYVYTLETQTAGSGIAWLQSYGFFTEDYYAYKQNKLESGCVSAKKVYGFNIWDEQTELGTYNITDGTKNNSTSAQGRLRVKNPISVKPNTTYYKTTPNIGFRYLLFYDKNMGYLGYQNLSGNASFTTPSNAHYMVSYTESNDYGTTYKHDICINLFDSSKNGTYEPYVEPTTYPISPTTLRGLFKLSTDKLTVDGDEYNADGSVTRKYGIVDFETVTLYDQSSSSTETEDCYRIVPPNCDLTATKTAITNIIGNYLQSNYGIYLRIPKQSSHSIQIGRQWFIDNGCQCQYFLATPTAEQTTPFTETEIVGSTEKFIDYEVAQGNRDVAIPVGTETDYYQEMKLPSLPTTSGNHNLIYNPSTGFGWS